MSQEKTITILQLYPNEMNIYGDWGNVLTLGRRLQWHGYTPRILAHSPGQKFPNAVDIIVGGGGQDSGQNKVQDDLLKNSAILHKLANDNVPMLMICGLYQLFGRFFKTADGETIKGIEIFKAETHAGPKRLIGNVILDTDFGDVIGYENHSGLTVLDNNQPAFGVVKKGAGNNGTDQTEGAVYKNVIGSYLHGSLLPKNPSLADTLIEAAVTRKYGEFNPEIIDDRFAQLARATAAKRPR
ncbi:MAG TPA: glutamine amidotransferase [Candidatus Saccharimonadales bacterium]